MTNQAVKFRDKFDFSKISKEIYRWFPGHMHKGLKKMYETLPNIDAAIEVHDARIPFTGRTLSFRKVLIGNKPYAYVLNKADLADLTHKEKIVKKLEQENYSPCFFTVLKDSKDKACRKILPNLIEQINKQMRFNRDFNTSYNLLVIGVPNVGKSTLINRLRNFHLKQGNAVRMGALPGITRAVQNKVKVNQNPLVYVYDTPGILEPSFDDIEIGFKLACLNCIKGHQVNSDLLADYLLFRLNKSLNFKYVEHYGLTEPNDTILDVLIHIAKTKNKTKMLSGFNSSIKKVYDIEECGMLMIKDFFDGKLGKSMLDDDLILASDYDKNKLDLETFV